MEAREAASCGPGGAPGGPERGCGHGAPDQRGSRGLTTTLVKDAPKGGRSGNGDKLSSYSAQAAASSGVHEDTHQIPGSEAARTTQCRYLRGYLEGAAGAWSTRPKTPATPYLVDGRSDRIRTCDPLTPSQVRYQAAPRSDIGKAALLTSCGPRASSNFGRRRYLRRRGAACGVSASAARPGVAWRPGGRRGRRPAVRGHWRPGGRWRGPGQAGGRQALAAARPPRWRPTAGA